MKKNIVYCIFSEGCRGSCGSAIFFVFFKKAKDESKRFSFSRTTLKKITFYSTNMKAVWTILSLY